MHLIYTSNLGHHFLTSLITQKKSSCSTPSHPSPAAWFHQLLSWPTSWKGTWNPKEQFPGGCHSTSPKMPKIPFSPIIIVFSWNIHPNNKLKETVMLDRNPPFFWEMNPWDLGGHVCMWHQFWFPWTWICFLRCLEEVTCTNSPKWVGFVVIYGGTKQQKPP